MYLLLVVKVLLLLLTLVSNTKGQKSTFLGRERNSLVGRRMVLRDGHT